MNTRVQPMNPHSIARRLPRWRAWIVAFLFACKPTLRRRLSALVMACFIGCTLTANSYAEGIAVVDVPHTAISIEQMLKNAEAFAVQMKQYATELKEYLTVLAQLQALMDMIQRMGSTVVSIYDYFNETLAALRDLENYIRNELFNPDYYLNRLKDPNWYRESPCYRTEGVCTEEDWKKMTEQNFGVWREFLGKTRKLLKQREKTHETIANSLESKLQRFQGYLTEAEYMKSSLDHLQIQSQFLEQVSLSLLYMQTQANIKAQTEAAEAMNKQARKNVDNMSSLSEGSQNNPFAKLPIPSAH